MTRAKYETFNGVSWVVVTNNSFIPKIKTPVRRKSAQYPEEEIELRNEAEQFFRGEEIKL